MSKKIITFYDSNKTAHDFSITSTDYGICDTNSDVVDKIVTCDDFSLFIGAEITVKFSKAPITDVIKLNVNNSGAIAVDFSACGNKPSEVIKANGCYGFIYDGTSWFYKGSGSKCIGKSGTGENSTILNNLSNNIASGKNSIAAGNQTKAKGENQFVSGKYNKVDTENQYAVITGIGTANENLLNGYTLDWNGNAVFAGTVTSGTKILAEKTTIINYTPTDTSNISYIFNTTTDSVGNSNSETRIVPTLTTSTITITMMNGVFNEDYMSSLVFTTAENSNITMAYTGSGALQWIGIDCSVKDNYSIFTPKPSKTYDIVFYFNGTKFIGLVNGYENISVNITE